MNLYCYSMDFDTSRAKDKALYWVCNFTLTLGSDFSSQLIACVKCQAHGCQHMIL
jgi:hypothetical protein